MSPSRLPRVLQSLPDPFAPVASGEPAAAGLQAVQDALAYRFRAPALLRVALTLGSWANEHVDAGWPSNACLEFFGDAVLDLVAADVLWRRFPDLAEGQLTRLRASLVAEGALAEVAGRLGLGDHLLLGRGDAKQGAREHAGILADAVEAVLGAVFLDAREAAEDGIAAASAVFERVFADALDRLRPEEVLDPKSRLQHVVQGRYRITPVYARTSARGASGETRWVARVELPLPDGTVRFLGEGQGRSLKLAERAAAESGLARLEDEDD